MPRRPGHRPSCSPSCIRAIIAAAVSNIIVATGVRLLGPTRVTTVQALVPAMAVVFAFLLLGEPIYPGQVIGGAIIVIGVALDPAGQRARPDRAGMSAADEAPPPPAPAWPAPALSPPLLVDGAPPLALLVDYDGTIALTDVSDIVMAEYVAGDWEAEAAAYDAGRIGSRRLMTLEMAMVDSDPADLLATAAAQPHDPGFIGLVRRAQAAGIPVEVVSDGFGFFIEPALAALGVPDLPVVTARTTFRGRRASIDYPNGNPRCLVCGTCKRDRVLAHRAAGRRVAFIGDGESDRYAAGYSDVVFAKRSLVRICIEAGWPLRALDRVSGDRRLADRHA